MKEELAKAIMCIMYDDLNRDVLLDSLEGASIYVENIICSVDNIKRIQELLHISFTNESGSICCELTKNIELEILYFLDANSCVQITDIVSFYKTSDNRRIELSIESALQFYLGIAVDDEIIEERGAVLCQ